MAGSQIAGGGTHRPARVVALTLAVLAAGIGTVSTASTAPPAAAAEAPVVAELTATPQRPNPGQAIAVRARLEVGSTATLTYKVLFGPDVAVPLLDGTTSPGGAGDGVYGATIPGQRAGTLVRYRVDAVSPAATGAVAYSAPAADDSVRYRGVVVRDPAVTSTLPTIEWFMDDAVYEDILANHRIDGEPGPAVWAYDGVVYDNVLMNVRGNSSRTAAKVNWKVELPAGYSFDLGGQLPYPLDEFALQNYSTSQADLAWSTVKAAGARGLAIVPVRTQRNGTFWSLGRIMETEDGSWREAQGVKKWAIYKGDGGSVGRTASPADLASRGWLDKKTRKTEDLTDVWTLANVVDAPPSAAQLAWIHENVNVPELVNYLAINAIIRHHDSGWYNWWLARDTEGTGRWEMWHWDLNWTFTTASSDTKGPFLTPDTSNKFTQAMLAYPELREMYFRRLRTLADQFLAPGTYEAQWDAISARTTPDWNLDRARWGGYTPASGRSSFVAGLADRRTVIAANTGPGKPVPTSQSATAAVVVNEIQYRPAGTGGEFIELANPGTTAVDLSGWSIDAVGLVIQPGTVVPAGGRVLFVANDVAFRQAHRGANGFVGGQFPGSLDDAGEAVVLRQGSRVVDAVTYSSAAPWPAAANGSGPSLELTSPTADNAVAANWRATSTTGGTPGLANTPAGPTPPASTVAVPFGASWRYDDSRTDRGTAWREPAYVDASWKQGVGRFGFGIGGEGTVLSPGPDSLRIITSYFRTSFTVADPGAVTGVTLDLIRDDGAVVYVNGVEVVRANLPAGTIRSSTFASANVTGSASTTPTSYVVPASVLRAGTNTVAVEVHQNYRASSDVSFDARVTLRR